MNKTSNLGNQSAIVDEDVIESVSSEPQILKTDQLTLEPEQKKKNRHRH